MAMCLMHILYVSSVLGIVSTDQTSYTVAEDVGQLEFLVSITSGRIAPGRECEIVVTTNDGSAEGEFKVTFYNLHLVGPA